MSNQEIINAIHGLVREGKSVTTAAVRARLAGPVPMSELLQLIGRYKQAPASLPGVTPAPVPAADPADDLRARIEALENRLARLERQLEQAR